MMLTYPDLTVSKYKQAMVFSPAALNRMAENLRESGRLTDWGIQR